ncbi:MAG TPA: OmpA family protein [Rhizomicrobium sp.]|jgi:outer membrane protein OmpA-like peptidoglycan-associated protein|nr:OmpA family protein [Rhizomicrobium sp.]
MARAHRFFNRLTAGVALAAAGLALSACVSTSSMDDLAGATPSGSAFTQQLFKNYAFLAHSFGASGGGGGGGSSFDSEDSMSLFDDGGDNADLAEAFATKALIAAKGNEVDPEPSTDDDSAQARDRLIKALSDKKDQFPVDAARAQTDFDCWMLNATVPAQAAAASQCRASFSNSIARLEHDGAAPAFTPPPAAAPAPSKDFTVYFDFDSWTLTGEQLTVLQQAIATARAGGQSHIAVVGHTDTSGSADYNQALSVKRANVVTETLVDMGARREAIQISGVGETDLAVQTPDGIKEPKNRRAVVTLMP